MRHQTRNDDRAIEWARADRRASTLVMVISSCPDAELLAFPDHGVLVASGIDPATLDARAIALGGELEDAALDRRLAIRRRHGFDPFAVRWTRVASVLLAEVRAA